MTLFDKKEEAAYRSISEVSKLLDIPTHVLRFWETQFPSLRPNKTQGKRRLYGLKDIQTVQGLKKYLYKEKYTIKGVKNLIKEYGIDALRNQSINNVNVSDDKELLSDIGICSNIKDILVKLKELREKL